MRRRLFEDLVVSRAAGGARNRTFSLPASMAIHAAVLGVMLVLPMLGSDDLPDAKKDYWPVRTVVIADTRPAPPPAVVARRSSTAGAPHAAQPAVTHGAPPPIVEPTGFEPSATDTDVAPCLSAGCIPDGRPDEAVGIGPIGEPAPPALPMRVDYRTIKPPVKIRDVAPVYPDIARRASVQGVVVIECTIDTTGRVVGAQVLSGHPLLAPAALEAVQQWIYVPTLLNGTPVSVIMTVTVNFRLNR